MSTQPAVPGPGKILVIDDNPIIQRAVLFALRDHGYKVLMCGELAGSMDIIRTERPDLILIDLTFPPDSTNLGSPIQDGFFVINWLRTTPVLEKIPLVIISGTEPASYQERIAGLGVKACLHKPLNKEALLATIQQVLGDKTPGEQPNQS